MLKKRAIYKHLLKSEDIDLKLRSIIYDLRQTSLKWILVTSFGYRGFNNAKFGRIDAHIAVCAFDRQTLLHAAKIAERCGYRVKWYCGFCMDKEEEKEAEDDDKTVEDLRNYLKLKESIEQQTGFKISLKVHTNGLLLFIPKQTIFYLFPTATLEYLKMVT